jgi:beta-phosphoglucomutase-like phosphatase (HAD superfamily)
VFPATLFDFNGVLVDDEHVHLEAFRDAVRPLGIEITDREYWDELLGFDDAGAFEALLDKAGLPADAQAVAQLIEDKRPLYMARARSSLRTFAGAAELVRARAEAGPVAIVSGALTDEIEFGLEHLGVRDLVGNIISAEDTKTSKPDSEGYLKGIAWLRDRIGDGASRALVIEDSVDGIAAAKKAGLPTVAVAHSYPEERLRQTGADLVLPRLADLDGARLLALYDSLYS